MVVTDLVADLVAPLLSVLLQLLPVFDASGPIVRQVSSCTSGRTASDSRATP
jgi:hypothetical protein